MTDREKVIKGLECRLDINGSKYKHCLTCDYRHDIDHCQWACQTDGILEDALALLKAQEARVMTLEEVETLPYGYVLIETDKQDSLRWLDALLFCKNANFSFDFITLEGRARLLGAEYNREWRCWTSCPTDEQREATPWES